MNDKKPARPPIISFSLFNSFLLLLALSVTGLIILLIWGFQEYARPADPAGRPGILYLTWDENEHNQLHFIDPAGGAPQQLTFNPLGIGDFAVSPDGSQVVFSAWRDDGGSDLFLLNPDNGEPLTQLLNCDGDLCSGAVWAPAGDLLVYERRPLTEVTALPESPRLWWLDPATGETIAVFADPQRLGHSAGFSHDGTWLSYVAPQFQEVHAYNRETGQTVVIASQTGEPAAWHPTDNVMLTSEIQPQGEAFATHLFRVEISSTEASAEVINLSNERAVNDGTASFSPDGSLILFGRKVSRAPMGRQLWVMDPDGSNPRRLTDEFEFHHGQPSWSPAGDQILMQRFNINQPDVDPGIWVLDIAGGELTEIITPGIRPVWLPQSSPLFKQQP